MRISTKENGRERQSNVGGREEKAVWEVIGEL